MLFSNYVLRAWNAVVDGSESMFCRCQFSSLIIGQHWRLTKSLKRSRANINSHHNRSGHKKMMTIFWRQRMCKISSMTRNSDIMLRCVMQHKHKFFFLLVNFCFKVNEKRLFWIFFCWIWIEIFCRLAEIEAPARRRWWIIGEWYKFWQRRFNEATTSSPIDGQS